MVVRRHLLAEMDGPACAQAGGGAESVIGSFGVVDGGHRARADQSSRLSAAHSLMPTSREGGASGPGRGDREPDLSPRSRPVLRSEGFRVGATVMVIAHRLAVLRETDRILVRENGTVVESGQDEELANAGGAFAPLLANQET